MQMLILAAALGMAFLQSDEKIYKIGDPGVTAPVVTYVKKADYTGAAMQRKVQGTVILTAVVKTDGTVRDDVQVIQSLDPDLDAQAVKAARLWTFKPATKDDTPVNVAVRIESTFTLRTERVEGMTPAAQTQAAGVPASQPRFHVSFQPAVSWPLQGGGDREIVCGLVVIHKTPADDPKILLPARETGAAVRRIEPQGCEAKTIVTPK